MSDTIRTSPEVDSFVAAVRARFSDLDADEREELLGGLEADMGDLVAERGPEALGDPDAYAAELRAAAGLEPAGRTSRGGRALGATVESLLDGAHARWSGLVTGLPGDPWGFVQSLRPAWWVLRAWVALQLVDLVWGSGSYNLGLSVVPSLLGWGVPILLVAIIVSVQIGRGKVWPGRGSRGSSARVLLLGLNVLAIALTPVVAREVLTPAKVEQWGMDATPSRQMPSQGLSFNGRPISNIHPYDAAGNPLVGVQLVDGEGRRLKVDQETLWQWKGDSRVLSPWFNGRTPLLNVFPLPEQAQDMSTGKRIGEPTIQTPPFAELPPVTLDGVTASRLVRPDATKEQAATSVKRRGE